MKRIVLDASALMTFFEDRPGADKVEDLIRLGIEGKRQLLMSVVNWGEVYYSTWRAKGPGVARKVLDDIA
jgi:PIN domain nuclease of toxin-antitoxin system